VASLRAQFAENLRAIRDYIGLTRDQFCELLGVELSTLISVENADHAPSFDVLEQFASKLNVQVWELFRFDPDFTSELRQRINHSITTK
jgi:transcriptional regulator with XRE-family HTH domain